MARRRHKRQPLQLPATCHLMYMQPRWAGTCTIAVDHDYREAENVTVLCAGFAYCGPNDNFNKVDGRNKALGRLRQLMSAADGWRLAEAQPDKYQQLRIVGRVDQKEVFDFIELCKTIATHMVPAAIAAERDPD